MLPSETYPVSRTSTAQTTAETASASGRQPEHDPCGRGYPFPSLESHEHREHVSQDGRHTACQREQLGVGHPGSEDQHRDDALGDIDQRGRNCVLPAENPVEIGGAEVAAAVLPKIDSREEVG